MKKYTVMCSDGVLREYLTSSDDEWAEDYAWKHKRGDVLVFTPMPRGFSYVFTYPRDGLVPVGNIIIKNTPVEMWAWDETSARELQKRFRVG
jgi:hypothetical protein